MHNKRIKRYYQVFISSPSKGFEEIRKSITNEILQQDQYFPVAMELMAANDNTFKMLYNYMRNSDVCVLLIGDSAGSMINKASRYLTPEMKNYLRKLYMKPNGIKSFEELTYTEFEYATAKYLNIKILAFANSDSVNKIHNKQVPESAQRLYNVVREQAAHGELTPSVIVTALNNHFRDETSSAGWIRETDSKIFHSAMVAGITDISLDGIIEKEKLRDMLNNSTTLKIMFTTGKAFFVSNSSLLLNYIANGGNVKFLCVEPNTKEMLDIQEIEECALHCERNSIHKELLVVLQEIMEISDRAKQQSERINKKTGKIEIGFCDSLFRSSFLIFQNEKTNNNSGWFTVTLPPAKSRETISFAIESSKGKNSTNNLLNRSIQHFDAVWDFALKHQKIISFDTNKIKYASEKNNYIKDYWESKQRTAISNIKKRKRFKGILIEVAAQHPLKDGIEPNEEFEARLNVAIDLYNKKVNEGYDVEIYVPGSVHLDFDGVPDDVSLSCAGSEYLIENGIPKQAIHGDDLNNKYDFERFHKGVYNSADECFIASKYFFEKGDFFKTCYSVCSPNQAMRKILLYLEFGIYPKIITVPTDNMFHNFINELFTAIPYIVNEDHNYQGEKSREALRTRSERKPTETFGDGLCEK